MEQNGKSRNRSTHIHPIQQIFNKSVNVIHWEKDIFLSINGLGKMIYPNAKKKKRTLTLTSLHREKLPQNAS